jgi:hypothetical protein
LINCRCRVILTEEVLLAMLELINKYKNYINNDLIYPQVKWN